jgi:DnaJ-domain-containing protein 1
MLRVMYQAAKADGKKVEPHDVVYFDVANAARVRSKQEDADLASTIDNGCETLAGMV